jgi:hypothetical protein
VVSFDAESLRAINDLITDPLKELVAERIDAGHDRLARALETVGRDLARHIADTAAAATVRDAEVKAIKEEISALKGFRLYLTVVYGVITVILSTGFGFAIDWFKRNVFPGKG